MHFRSLIFFILSFSVASSQAQQPFYQNYRVKDGLLSNYTYFVFQDSKGYIWVGSDVGATRFDGHNFTNFNTSRGMTDNEVFSMYEDKQGRLWFATLNGKPCYYQSGHIYSEANIALLKHCDLKGLVFRIFEDQQGDIVYASANKMVVFNVTKNTFHLIDSQERWRDVWQNSSGSIGLVSASNVYEYHSDSLMEKADLPTLSGPIRTLKFGDTLLISNLDIYYL